MPEPPNEWLDVTLAFTSDMPVWPEDPAVRIERLADMSLGDECNLTHLSFCAHTGTHMDAPFHYVQEGATIDQAPLDILVGVARVIEIRHPQAVTKQELVDKDIPLGGRVLFRTGNSLRHGAKEFNGDFIYIDREAAAYLVERRVVFVGIDGMSVGGFRNDLVETHEVLLGAGVWVVENLDLREIDGGDYDMVCLPLKIVGADGAPARVILRRIG